MYMALLLFSMCPRAVTLRNFIKVESARGLHIVQGVQFHMPIAIEFVPTRRKKIAVDVVPAEWQLYIAH